MGIASDGLALWRNDRRRAATQWFRRHGGAAMAAVAAQSAARATWEGAYRAGQATGAALRSSVDVLRDEQAEIHSPRPIRHASDIAADAERAARQTDSPAGQALAVAAATLAAEADAVQGATSTLVTVGGITAAMGTYSAAVERLAESVRGRAGDRSVVTAIDAASEAAGEAAEALRHALDVLARVYGAQVEQEDQTGTTLK